MPDYTELASLQHYVLEESWVLGVQASPGSLDIALDLTFAKTHPELRPAREGEVYYGRRALITFSGVTSLVWTGQGAPGARDATGERDWGAIDSLTWNESSFSIEGDFGTINVDAQAVAVAFTGPA